MSGIFAFFLIESININVFRSYTIREIRTVSQTNNRMSVAARWQIVDQVNQAVLHTANR